MSIHYVIRIQMTEGGWFRKPTYQYPALSVRMEREHHEHRSTSSSLELFMSDLDSYSHRYKTEEEAKKDIPIIEYMLGVIGTNNYIYNYVDMNFEIIEVTTVPADITARVVWRMDNEN